MYGELTAQMILEMLPNMTVVELQRMAKMRFGYPKSRQNLSRERLITALETSCENEKTHEAIARVARS